jgi:type I restriction enzyme M protein
LHLHGDHAPWKQASAIPEGFDWPSLTSKDGDALETHYRHILEELGKSGGMLGIIFRKAQNKIQDPAKLKRLIADLIDREKWSTLDADVKGNHGVGPTGKEADPPVRTDDSLRSDPGDRFELVS